MKFTILETLLYNVTIVSSNSFLDKFLEAETESVANVARMILDTMLQSHAMLDYRPSLVAAAAVAIGRRSLHLPTWNGQLLQSTLYAEDDVVPVASIILAQKVTLVNPECKAIWEKYVKDENGCVALMRFDGLF